MWEEKEEGDNVWFVALGELIAKYEDCSLFFCCFLFSVRGKEEGKGSEERVNVVFIMWIAAYSLK